MATTMNIFRCGYQYTGEEKIRPGDEVALLDFAAWGMEDFAPAS
jgi:hypothetical protein